MSKERNERHRLRFQVVFDDGESFMSGPVLDISDSGMFIETVMPASAGRKVRITPLLPEQAGVFEFEGEVVRASEIKDLEFPTDEKLGMGVRFLDPDPEQVRLVVEFFKAGEETARDS